MHIAAQSNDRRARANAGEFLDVLLARRDQQGLRAALRTVVDDASDAERVDRAAREGRALARTHEDALAALVQDRDDALAALAAHHAMTSNDPTLRATVSRVREGRPSMRAMTTRLFGPDLKPEAQGG